MQDATPLPIASRARLSRSAPLVGRLVLGSGFWILLALAACEDDAAVDPGGAGDTDAGSSSGGSSSGSARDASEPGQEAGVDASDEEVTDASSLPDAETDAQAPFGAATAKVVVGGTFACALKTAGTVVCWGENERRALGNGSTQLSPRFYPEPAAVVGPGGVGVLDQVIDLAAGPGHVCAVRYDGTVWCWGTSVWGELGSGEQGLVSAVPVQVQQVEGGPLRGARAVFAGYDVSCAIVGPQRVAQCWGWNGFGQLGIGTPGGSTPAAGEAGDDGLVPGVSRAARPMLSYDGTARMTNVRSIGIGYGYVCVASETLWQGYAEGLGAGAVWCVGQHNADIQLGDGQPADGLGAPRRRGYPVPVRTPRGDAWLSGIDHISAGYSHTCVFWNNHVTCWGGGAARGDSAGDAFALNAPVGGWSFLRPNVTPLLGQLLPTGGVGEKDVAVGELSLSTGTTCARVNVVDNEQPATQLAHHAVRCMGTDVQGGFGDGNPGETRGAFGKVVAPEWTVANGNVFLDEVRQLASGGGSQTCALREDGEIFCWGSSNGGLMGPHDAGPVDYAIPTPVLRADGSRFNLLD